VKSAVLLVRPDELKEARRLLSLTAAEPDSKECMILMNWIVKFRDGVCAEIQICNGDTGPWLQLLLFGEDGHEMYCSDVIDEFPLGTVALNEGREMKVLVLRSDYYDSAPIDDMTPEEALKVFRDHFDWMEGQWRNSPEGLTYRLKFLAAICAMERRCTSAGLS